MTQEEMVNEIHKEAMKDCGSKAVNSPSTISHELILRTGEALKPQEPRTVNITGVIDSPLRWLKKRKGTIDLNQCNIKVSRDEMLIILSVGEHDHYIDLISGKLILSEEYKRFGINQGKYVSGMELSDLIRMNRTCFESKETAMQLVTTMRNFKAKVLNEIEKSDDKKGNVSQLRRQTIESNQPPSFDISIPVFKGQPKSTFTVEIDIDPDTLLVTLISPDAQDMIMETRDRLIEEVLNEIEVLCPEIPIIEI